MMMIMMMMMKFVVVLLDKILFIFIFSLIIF